MSSHTRKSTKRICLGAVLTAAMLWVTTIPQGLAAVPEQPVVTGRVTAINLPQQYLELDGSRYCLAWLIRGAEAGHADAVSSLEVLETAYPGQLMSLTVSGESTATLEARVFSVEGTR